MISRLSTPASLMVGLLVGAPPLLLAVLYADRLATLAGSLWSVAYSHLGLSLLYFVPAYVTSVVLAGGVVRHLAGRPRRDWHRTALYLETITVTGPQVGLLGTAAAMSSAISTLAEESPAVFLTRIGPAFNTTVAGLVISLFTYLLRRVGEVLECPLGHHPTTNTPKGGESE